MRRSLAGILLAAATTAAFTSPALGVETSEEYVAAVNPICKDAAQAAKRIPKKVGSSGDPVVDFIRRVARYGTILDSTTGRILKVKPPASDAKEVRSWTKGLRGQGDLIDLYVAAAKRRDGARAIALGGKVAKLEKQNRKKAQRLGLKACAGVKSG